MIYAPKLIPPARNERLIAQIDIAPTLLGLLNWSYTSKFIGHDVNRLPPGKEHALISTYQTVGYLETTGYSSLNPASACALKPWTGDLLAMRPTDDDPAAVEEAISVYPRCEPGLQDRVTARVELKSCGSDEAWRNPGNPKLPACRFRA